MIKEYCHERQWNILYATFPHVENYREIISYIPAVIYCLPFLDTYASYFIDKKDCVTLRQKNVCARRMYRQTL